MVRPCFRLCPRNLWVQVPQVRHEVSQSLHLVGSSPRENCGPFNGHVSAGLTPQLRWPSPDAMGSVSAGDADHNGGVGHGGGYWLGPSTHTPNWGLTDLMAWWVVKMMGQKYGTSARLIRRKDLKPSRPTSDSEFLRRAEAAARRAEAKKAVQRRVELVEAENRRATP
jgi:hypothetical protein